MRTDPEDFRRDLRSWLAREVGLPTAPLSHRERQLNSTALHDAGFGALTWPQEYGGQELPALIQTIFNEEVAPYADALLNTIVTVGICATTLLQTGTDAQRRQYLPSMLRGESVWAQLLSEPGAGSDLANVSTRADLHGNTLILNGQKVWTSGAQHSDFAIALVRTHPDRPRHAGLSAVVVDLSASGVDVRPLRDMTGTAVFNEVFLDDVPVPLDDVLGELNGGWQVLRTMLTNERIALSAGTSGARMDQDAFPALLELARRRGTIGLPSVRQTLAEVYVQQRLLDLLGVRLRAVEEAGLVVGPLGSLGKVGTARAARAAAEAEVALAGAGAQAWSSTDPDGGRWASHLLSFPKNGIAGGTTEIQKNLIAERLLGLPREA